MNWITEQIAIGNYLEAQDAELLKQESISSVLSLDRSLADKQATELGLRSIENVPLEDTIGTIPGSLLMR